MVEGLLSRELVEVLACPVDKSGLDLVKNVLVCSKCRREYAVKDGIPVLLPPET